MEEALNWWYNILTDSGRAQFPKPLCNDDIEGYYYAPAEYVIGSLDKLNS